MTEKQLNWIQRNRAPKGRAKLATLIGQVAQDILGSGQLAGPAWKSRLLEVLEEHAGPALLDHAEPLTVRNGILTLGVEEPAVLYHLRLQWEQRILQLVQSGLPEAGISAVRFIVHIPR